MATQLESSLHISDLILQASPVVQLVMLVLVLASVFSWYLIAKLHMGYKKARQGDDHFQKYFGLALNLIPSITMRNLTLNAMVWKTSFIRV